MLEVDERRIGRHAAPVGEVVAGVDAQVHRRRSRRGTEGEDEDIQRRAKRRRVEHVAAEFLPRRRRRVGRPDVDRRAGGIANDAQRQSGHVAALAVHEQRKGRQIDGGRTFARGGRPRHPREGHQLAIGVEDAHIGQARPHRPLVHRSWHLDLLEQAGRCRARAARRPRSPSACSAWAVVGNERSENEMADHGVTSLRGGTGAR